MENPFNSQSYMHKLPRRTLDNHSPLRVSRLHERETRQAHAIAMLRGILVELRRVSLTFTRGYGRLHVERVDTCHPDPLSQ
jgi:hypothetical protein